MLGFAFSEAQRTQDTYLRLKHQQNQNYQQQQPPSQRAFPPNVASSSLQSVYSAANSTVSSDNSKTARRRRRQRKPKLPEGGVVSTHTSAAAQDVAATLTADDGANDRSNKHLFYSLRCGLVGTGNGGLQTALGRVVLLNWDNELLVDAFIKVPVPVLDFCTEYTGIEPGDLTSVEAISLDSARAKVGGYVQGKILIGHGLQVDLSILRLSHPQCDVRDTATYKPFMQGVSNGTKIVRSRSSDDDILVDMVDEINLDDVQESQEEDDDDDCDAATNEDHVETDQDLLPREMDDLTANVLKRELRPYGYRLIDEAISCSDLYKSVRFQWEGELAKEMQQKERQRVMLTNMRFKRSASIDQTINDRPVNKRSASQSMQGLPGHSSYSNGANSGYRQQQQQQQQQQHNYRYNQQAAMGANSYNGPHVRYSNEQFQHPHQNQLYQNNRQQNNVHYNSNTPQQQVQMNPNAPQFRMTNNAVPRTSNASLDGEDYSAISMSPPRSAHSQSSSSNNSGSTIRNARTFFGFGKNRKSRLEALNAVAPTTTANTELTPTATYNQSASMRAGLNDHDLQGNHTWIQPNPETSLNPPQWEQARPSQSGHDQFYANNTNKPPWAREEAGELPSLKSWDSSNADLDTGHGNIQHFTANGNLWLPGPLPTAEAYPTGPVGGISNSNGNNWSNTGVTYLPSGHQALSISGKDNWSPPSMPYATRHTKQLSSTGLPVDSEAAMMEHLPSELLSD